MGFAGIRHVGMVEAIEAHVIYIWWGFHCYTLLGHVWHGFEGVGEAFKINHVLLVHV